MREVRGKRERIAVIGGGGVGGVVAAKLAQAGHDVTLCVRRPISQLVLETAGKSQVVPVAIATRPEETDPVDWVFLTTKAQDTAGAADWLRRFDRPGTTIAVLQNGIDQEQRVSPFIASAAIVPAIVYIAGERTEAGHVVHLGHKRLVVPDVAAGHRLADLLENVDIDLQLDPDFKTAAWRKLLSNASANPITALTLRRAGVLSEPGVLALVRQILEETVAVARAVGAKLDQRDIENILALHAGFDPSFGSSMLYDRLAKRPTEHAYLTGAIVRTGSLHGVPTPVNNVILTLLEAMDVNAPVKA